MHLNFQVPLNTNPSSDTVLRHQLRSSDSSIPPRLQSYECHFNWAKHYPLTPNEINHGLLLLEEKFRDESSEIDSILYNCRTAGGISGTGGGRCSSDYFILIIAEKLTQAHFNIEIGNFSEAKECLGEAENFLSRCVVDDDEDEDGGGGVLFPPDYSQGFTYIIEGIKVFLQSSAAVSGSESGYIMSAPNMRVATTTATSLSSKLRMSKVSVGGLKHFKRLPAKAKFIVWTVRDVFFIYSFRSNVERSDWMESIVEMEPYIPKWHFYLYRALYRCRKLVPRPIPVLLLEEGKQERILTRWSEGNENGHDGGGQNRHYPDPLSISYQAVCITQMFIERRTPPGGPHHQLQTPTSPTAISPGNQYPWRFGKTLFENPFQVMSDIQRKTLYELINNPVEIKFSSFITKPHHEQHTNAFYDDGGAGCVIKMSMLQNHKQAVDHFREGIKNPNNIGAIFGLLQLLMAEPVENTLEIQSILKYTMKNRELTKVWDKRVLRTLHYLKGCFHFMQQEKDIDEAITSWIIAHDNESPKWSYYFHNLSHQCDRFGWPTKRLNLTNVSKALKHVAYLERTQFRQLLLDICSEVDDAIRRDERKSSIGNIYK